MKPTLTFLVVLATAVTAGCSHMSSPVAPPDAGVRSDVVQATSSADSLSTEQRGVYTFGSGN